MANTKLNETAASGSVGAGSIAVRLDGPGVTETHKKKLQEFLRDFDKRVVNRWKYSEIKPYVSESFDLQDVLSRLRGVEAKKSNPVDNVTYGVEDDNGNVMKVTVRRSQGPEFESVLAQELAALDVYTSDGSKTGDISMAELLFNLKDKFDIIDVDFPKIPTDVIYNADDASVSVEDSLPASETIPDIDEPDAVNDQNSPMDLMGMDDGGNDSESDETLELPEPEGDGEGVEEFTEPTEPEGSILDRVLDMLKAQAEAQTAQANAEAEKYRADQAEYSAKAAQHAVAQQEELARMELAMDKQNEQQKQAKKLADIAKFRVQQAAGVSVNEGDEGETVESVRRIMSNLPSRFELDPIPANASPEARREVQERNAHKQRQHQLQRKELQARMQSAREREAFRKTLDRKDAEATKDDNLRQPNQDANQ